jgi:hypothetical protein
MLKRILIPNVAAHGNVVGWGNATSKKVEDLIPDEFIEFFFF